MLFHHLLTSFKEFPNRRCIDLYTYNEVYKLVKKYNWLLENRGVGKNDRVCWDAKKSAHWPAIMTAAWLRGAVFVPFNHGNPSLNDHIVRTVKPKVVMTDKMVNDMVYEPPLLPEKKEDDPDAACMILFTSGSTNHPKGVVLSHKNIMTNINQISDRMVGDINHKDSAFSVLPWHHCYGLVCELLFLMKKGARISLPTSSSPKEIMREMKWKCPTLFFTVPKVLETIYKNDIHNAPVVLKRNLIFGHRIRRVSVGGALCPPKLISFLTEEYKVPTLQGYGMTETSPMISLNSIGQNRIGSVGKPVKDLRIDFCYENNEVRVRGDNIMSGYLKETTQDNQLILEENDYWFHTGDKGYIDKDGYLFIKGRVKTEYKLSNGKYTNPTYIEKILCMSPIIDQAVVFGDGLARNKVIVHSTSKVKDKDMMLFHIREILEGKTQYYEVPDDVIFAEEPFTLQNGMLTQKLEPNRNKILKSFA